MRYTVEVTVEKNGKVVYNGLSKKIGGVFPSVKDAWSEIRDNPPTFDKDEWITYRVVSI